MCFSKFKKMTENDRVKNGDINDILTCYKPSYVAR